jgi:transposase
VLKTFGLRADGRAGRVFGAKVRQQVEDRPEVAGVAEPLLAAWRAVRDQIAALDRKLIEAAKGDATCRSLMTCPGVGVVVATSFSAAVEVLWPFPALACGRRLSWPDTQATPVGRDRPQRRRVPITLRPRLLWSIDLLC